MNLSVIQNFRIINYKSTPYPHIVIKNALPNDVYKSLKNEYQLIINYLKKKNNFSLNNTRLQLNSINFLGLEEFKNTLWYDFIIYHTSKNFFLKLCEIFEKDLKKIYPDIYKIILKNKNENNFISLRDNLYEKNSIFDFVSDCQPGINTPVWKESSVRGPHVDNPVELFGGLFYLKDEDDNAGGDLEIFSINKDPLFEGKAEIANKKNLTLHSKVSYEENVFVIFLNSNKSIHGITSREKTQSTRNLINIIFETYKYKKLFNLDRNKNFFANFFKRFI